MEITVSLTDNTVYIFIQGVCIWNCSYAITISCVVEVIFVKDFNFLNCVSYKTFYFRSFIGGMSSARST